MDVALLYISRPSSAGPKWKLVSRDFPCSALARRMLKGLSTGCQGDKKLNSILRPPTIARSIDPSFHLIIPPALHYPNYSCNARPSLVLDTIDPPSDVLCATSIGDRKCIFINFSSTEGLASLSCMLTLCVYIGSLRPERIFDWQLWQVAPGNVKLVGCINVKF